MAATSANAAYTIIDHPMYCDTPAIIGTAISNGSSKSTSSQEVAILNAVSGQTKALAPGGLVTAGLLVPRRPGIS